MPDFKELFQDICPKRDYIKPENNYLDLGTAINTEQLFGLLTPIHGVGKASSIISCDEELAKEIISNANTEMVDKISNLFATMFDLDSNPKKNQQSQGPMLIKKKS